MAGLFDSEVKGNQPATSGTGLFGNSGDFLTQQRNKISQTHTQDRQDRENPFRMLGGAMKTYNLQNSPEVQQMRDTENIMKQIDVRNEMEVGVAYKELMKIGNPRGAIELLQQHKSLASAPPADLKTSVQEIDGRKLLINTQDGATIKDLGPADGDKDVKLYEHQWNAENNSYTPTNNSIKGPESTIHPQNKQGMVYSTKERISGGKSLGDAMSQNDEIELFKYVDKQLQQVTKETDTSLTALNTTLPMLSKGLNDPNYQYTAEDNLAITKNISGVFISNVKAMADQVGWANLGSFPTRFASAFSQFFTGTRTQGQIDNMRSLLTDYKTTLSQSLNRKKAKSWDKYVALLGDDNQAEPKNNTLGNAKAKKMMAEDRYVTKKIDGKSYKIDKWVPEENEAISKELLSKNKKVELFEGTWYLFDLDANTSEALWKQ